MHGYRNMNTGIRLARVSFFHSPTSMFIFRLLEKVDRKIANLLQKDNQIPVRELAS